MRFGLSSGSIGSSNEAQLAAFDAMVFFAVCLLICNILIANAQHGESSQLDSALANDHAETLLRVFLASSIGERFELNSCDLIITGYEPIADVLAVMVELRLQGVDLSPYAPVLALCGSVLSCVCSYIWAPELRAYGMGAGEMTPLLSFGEHASCDGDRLSASQIMTTRDGVQVLLVLTLAPSLPAHLVPV